MSEERPDDFWSKVGEAMRPRRPDAFWADQRSRILTRLGPARTPLLPWILVPALAAAAAGLLVLSRGPGEGHGKLAGPGAPKAAPGVEAPVAPAPAPQAPEAVLPVEAPPSSLSLVSPPTEEDWNARITSVEGQVTFFAKGEEVGIEAAVDTPLEEGDHVETGSEGRAELALAANSVIELGPDSVFTVKSLKKKETLLELAMGLLVAKLHLKEGDEARTLDVRTPVAVASVRGTEFAVSVGSDGGTDVGVFDEGRVAVRSADEASAEASAVETMVSPHQELSFSRATDERSAGRGRTAQRWRPSSLRSLSRLAGHAERLQRIRGRQRQLGANWRNFQPGQFQQLRQAMRSRQEQRLQAMPEDRRQEMRNRLRRRQDGDRRGRGGFQRGGDDHRPKSIQQGEQGQERDPRGPGGRRREEFQRQGMPGQDEDRRGRGGRGRDGFQRQEGATQSEGGAGQDGDRRGRGGRGPGGFRRHGGFQGQTQPRQVPRPEGQPMDQHRPFPRPQAAPAAEPEQRGGFLRQDREGRPGGFRQAEEGDRPGGFQRPGRIEQRGGVQRPDDRGGQQGQRQAPNRRPAPRRGGPRRH